MALPSGQNPNLVASRFVQAQHERELREEQGEVGDFRTATIPGIRMMGAGSLINPRSISVDLGIPGAASLANHVNMPASVPRVSLEGVQTAAAASIVSDVLAAENVALRDQLRRMHNVVVNARMETADLYSKFGKLASDWSETVKQMNALHDEQKEDYERRIEALEKTNEQLIKENNEMKKVIEDFKKLESEFEKQKRMLRLGQIAYKLEILVSEYVFPGDDKASKRARYGTNLKSLQGKVRNLKNQELQKIAASRLEGLNEEMFEDWFLGIVSELKKVRVNTAHPDLGTYEEIRSVINEEFSDDDKREDILRALEHLKEMYEKLNKNFGE